MKYEIKRYNNSPIFLNNLFIRNKDFRVVNIYYNKSKYDTYVQFHDGKNYKLNNEWLNNNSKMLKLYIKICIQIRNKKLL